MTVTALITRGVNRPAWGLGSGLGDGCVRLVDGGSGWRLADVAAENGCEINVVVLIGIGSGDGGLNLVQFAFLADALGSDCGLFDVSDFSGEGALGDHLDAFGGRVGDLRGEEADGA